MRLMNCIECGNFDQCRKENRIIDVSTTDKPWLFILGPGKELPRNCKYRISIEGDLVIIDKTTEDKSARYIDASKFDVVAYETPKDGGTFDDGVEFILDLLDIEQTIDVAPVVRGEWTDMEFFDSDLAHIDQWQSARCSVCGKYHTTPYMYHFDNFNYCPNCGAKMDERRTE